MELRLFHPKDIAGRSTKGMDRYNGYTNLIPCRMLELTGWYNVTVR